VGTVVTRAGAGAKLDAGLAGTFASAAEIVPAGTRPPLQCNSCCQNL
jgi:hypothetical protein